MRLIRQSETKRIENTNIGPYGTGTGANQTKNGFHSAESGVLQDSFTVNKYRAGRGIAHR